MKCWNAKQNMLMPSMLIGKPALRTLKRAALIHASNYSLTLTAS